MNKLLSKIGRFKGSWSVEPAAGDRKTERTLKKYSAILKLMYDPCEQAAVKLIRVYPHFDIQAAGLLCS